MSPLCVIMNLTLCIRTVTQEGYSIHAAVSEYYFEHYHRIARGPLRSNFPLSESNDRRQHQTERIERLSPLYHYLLKLFTVNLTLKKEISLLDPVPQT